MNMKTKIFYIVCMILEIALLVGAYMVNYFTQTRMGMLRHVVHKNYVWEETYPIASIKYISIVVFFILMLIVVVLYFKRKNCFGKIVTAMVITMVIVVFSFIGFVFVFSAEKLRAFYYISILLGVLTSVQIIKTFIGVICFKKNGGLSN